MFRKFGSISYTLERLKGAEKGHPEEHECVRNGQGFEVRKSAVRPECNEGRNKVPWGCRLCRPQRCEAHFASPPLMPFFTISFRISTQHYCWEKCGYSSEESLGVSPKGNRGFLRPILVQKGMTHGEMPMKKR